MPLVDIKYARLTADQKKRIGGRILDAFHDENIPAGTVVILFGREEADFMLEGQFLPVEGPVAEAPAPKPPPPPPAPAPAPKEPAVDYKSKLRRSRGELVELKNLLIKTLQAQGALSSFQAQEELGLKACDWAPATLRRFFSELEEEGVILKQGQKRGTRYVWKGITGQQVHQAPAAKLVKRAEDEPASGNA